MKVFLDSDNDTLMMYLDLILHLPLPSYLLCMRVNICLLHFELHQFGFCYHLYRACTLWAGAALADASPPGLPLG